MIDARDAFLQAAGLLNLDVCTVWSAFAARGLGASAALNPIEDAQPNDTALCVFESFDLPVTCGGWSPVAIFTLLSEDAELQHRLARRGRPHLSAHQP